MQPPIQKLTDTQSPIRVGDTTSVGPFVRITETKEKSYIYVLVYFDTNITDATQIGVYVDDANSESIAIRIEPSEKSNVEAEEQHLWSIVVAPDEPIKSGTEVNVIVNFNPDTDSTITIDTKFGEPKRATRVIRPK
ncbi:MAG: hypothetical protein AAF611_18975 [Bacteroidota bacterium]